MTQWGLDVLFNPSKRHMDEEKQRLQATRPIIGDASGGKRIDLESGKVRIKSKAAPAENSAVLPEEVKPAGSREDESDPGEAGSSDSE
ncbi:hypothetical protein SAMN05444157_0599 [Frankineae bacterium MT45]|nr:hypothetical protein SAMN05444157_0599 [Frankineae bacterium MT45]